MAATGDEIRALSHALDLAQTPGVPRGPNPRVGCVLLDCTGRVIGEGYHQGAGTPHAEVAALTAAVAPTGGTTAVVTLEPCTHEGRTGPCTQALIAAGVRRVVVASRDDHPLARGGVEHLRSAGIDVDVDVPPDLVARERRINRGWRHGLHYQRPFVTWKTATTLDGRVAAEDGSSRWITGAAARREVHDLREASDVVLVGTGTALVDYPTLTARGDDGSLRPHQPVRAVMGLTPMPPGHPLAVLPEGERTLCAHATPSRPAVPGTTSPIATGTNAPGPVCWLRTHDPAHGLSSLFADGAREVLLEGGARLAAAFMSAGLVDEVLVYLAPAFLGSGPAALGSLGITTIADVVRLDLIDVTTLQLDNGTCDVRLTLRPRRPVPESAPPNRRQPALDSRTPGRPADPTW